MPRAAVAGMPTKSSAPATAPAEIFWICAIAACWSREFTVSRAPAARAAGNLPSSTSQAITRSMPSARRVESAIRPRPPQPSTTTQSRSVERRQLADRRCKS